tara:strand:- start:5889 stop:6854 length:966 start_codon:yes stop_codon:yes gene_type:complete
MAFIKGANPYRQSNILEDQFFDNTKSGKTGSELIKPYVDALNDEGRGAWADYLDEHTFGSDEGLENAKELFQGFVEEQYEQALGTIVEVEEGKWSWRRDSFDSMLPPPNILEKPDEVYEDYVPPKSADEISKEEFYKAKDKGDDPYGVMDAGIDAIEPPSADDADDFKASHGIKLPLSLGGVEAYEQAKKDSDSPFKQEKKQSRRKHSGRKQGKMKYKSSAEKKFFSRLNSDEKGILRESIERQDFYALTVPVDAIARDLSAMAHTEEEAMLLAKKLKFEAQQRRGENWQPEPHIVESANETFKQVRHSQHSLNKATGRGY